MLFFVFVALTGNILAKSNEIKRPVATKEVRVLVVDENGAPVPKLEMSAAFLIRWQDDKKRNGMVIRSGYTGLDGRFTARGRTDVGWARVVIGR